MKKKDYLGIIEAMTAQATPSSTRNKLNKIHVHTDDDQLKNLVSPIIYTLDSTRVKVKVTIQTKQERWLTLWTICIFTMMNDCIPV